MADTFNERLQKSMQMLFTAKWNVPKAAEYSGISWEECKASFIEYMGSHRVTSPDEIHI